MFSKSGVCLLVCSCMYLCMCLCIGQREGTSERQTKCFLFSLRNAVMLFLTYKNNETESFNTSGHQAAFIMPRDLSLIFPEWCLYSPGWCKVQKIPITAALSDLRFAAGQISSWFQAFFNIYSIYIQYTLTLAEFSCQFLYSV